MNIVIPSYFLIHFIGKRDFQVCLMRLVQASLNILVHDVINLLYYEDLKDKQNVHLTLTLFRMGLYGAAHGWGGDLFDPPLLKSATHILQ